MDEDAAIKRFAERLGHEFEDRSLLRDALTHRSLANERPRLAPRDNERLEFLGDAVLGQLVSALLFELHPDAKEGELTRRRADLVCEGGLSNLAESISLGEVLRLGQGELRSGGRSKPRLLSSAFEACIAAIYLDGGYDAVWSVARTLLLPILEQQLMPGAQDFKSRAQELAQRLGWTAPVYHLVEESGPEHARHFRVAIHVDGKPAGEGAGRSKSVAEQAAAEVALPRIEEAVAAMGESRANEDDGSP